MTFERAVKIVVVATVFGFVVMTYVWGWSNKCVGNTGDNNAKFQSR